MYIHSDFTNALKLLYITYVTSANPLFLPLGCGYGGQWHDGVYTSPSATGGWGNSGRTGPGAVCALMATANKAGPYPARSSLGYARVPTRRRLRSCLGRAWWGRVFPAPKKSASVYCTAKSFNNVPAERAPRGRRCCGTADVGVLLRSGYRKAQPETVTIPDIIHMATPGCCKVQILKYVNASQYPKSRSNYTVTLQTIYLFVLCGDVVIFCSYINCLHVTALSGPVTCAWQSTQTKIWNTKHGRKTFSKNK